MIDVDVSVLRQCFNDALLAETAQKDYVKAFKDYVFCIEESTKLLSEETCEDVTALHDIKGEALFRIALIRKATDAFDLALQTVTLVSEEPYNHALRANAFVLQGLLYETKADIPAAEVAYRSAIQLIERHGVALERLVNPSDHVPWYLLGRCYMATSQYNDAFDAYNRAVNLNPTCPKIWCSLGVLYHAFGQYNESLEMFKKAVDLGAMPDAFYNIGLLYDMFSKKEDSRMAYEKSYDLSHLGVWSISSVRRRTRDDDIDTLVESTQSSTD